MISASRRGFLRLTCGGAWAAGALLEQSVVRAAAARSQVAQTPGNLFELKKMAQGVWAAVARPAAIVNCNAAVFELSDGLLVVDSHSKPSAAAALVGQVAREVSAKPVRYLVNSHFHFDHMQGNQVYREGGRRTTIIASEATRRLTSERAGTWLKNTLAGAQKSLEEARQRPGGEKLAAEMAAFIEEMKRFRLELPDVTVQGDLTIHDKEQELRIVFRGRGHTEGDISVWSPTRKALAAGDLAHGALPYMGDGFPKDWPATLRTLGELEFDRFVGGHGDVYPGKRRMEMMRDYIEELTAVVERAQAEGRTIEQVRKEATPRTLKTLSGGYLEALKDQMNEGQVAANVAGNIGQIWSALGRG